MSENEQRTGSLSELYDLQRSPRQRLLATAVLAVLGVGLATIHWSGIIVGGALVGWVWPTLGRALVAGFAFGLLVLATFGVTLLLWDAMGPALDLGPITLVTGAIPPVLATLGGLSRGLGRNAPRDRRS